VNVVGGEVFPSQIGVEDFAHDTAEEVTVCRGNFRPFPGSIDVAHLSRSASQDNLRFPYQFIPGISVLGDDA